MASSDEESENQYFLIQQAQEIQDLTADEVENAMNCSIEDEYDAN